MNEYDAKENLQDMYDVALCRIKNGDARGAIYLPPETLDSYIIGIKALEKQIAKKPIKAQEHIRYAMCYVCPNCGKTFSGTGIANYCYHCGQRLDWSGEDDGTAKEN